MKVNKSYRGILLESALIIFGISISFYLENWRHARADREKEKVYMQHIASDLEEDSVQLVRLLHKYARAEKLANRFTFSHIQFDKDKKLTMSKDSIALIIYVIFKNRQPPYDPINTSYTSIKFNGELDLIQNSNLGNKIIRYYEQNLIRQKMIDNNQQVNNFLSPLIAELIDVLDFYWLIFAHQPQHAKTDYYELYNNNRMRSAMGYSQDISEEILESIRYRMQSNKELRDSLKKELSK